MFRNLHSGGRVVTAVMASVAVLGMTSAAASAAPAPAAPGADTSAPVLSHHFIDIKAPRATVWRVFTQVDAWTTWQPHITAAKLDDKGFRPGGSFTWTSDGFTVTSHILTVRSQARVVWTGTAQGITGTHEWLFRSTPQGTRVITTESFSGTPVEGAVAKMQSILDASLPYWMKHLKARAERAA
jgi:uncharacterized protein YndB with AHSA1/START domain